MCINYAPTQRELLRSVFLVTPPDQEWKTETWQDYDAPIIRHDERGGYLQPT